MGKGAKQSGSARARNRERSQRAASYAAPTPAIRGSYPPIIKERIDRAVDFHGHPYHGGPKKAKNKAQAIKK